MVNEKKHKNYRPRHKMKRHILGKVFSRTTLILALFLLQIALLTFVLIYYSKQFYTYFFIHQLISIVLLAFLLAQDTDQTYMIALIITILFMPFLGSLIYIFVRIDIVPHLFKKSYRKEIENNKHLLDKNLNISKEFNKKDARFAGLANYLQNKTYFPTYKNNDLKYYKVGDLALDDILQSLSSAKKFITLEFFIVKDGIFWQEVLKILKQKAKEGVEIYFLYDGLNEMFNVSRRLPKRLKQFGIRARVFAPAKSPYPHRENYRNHRKSIVIDGEVAFVGGINLADEYINQEERFGHWKDAVLRVKGDSVNSITVMFFTMWNLRNRNPIDPKTFIVDNHKSYERNNFVVPYGDSPFSKETIAYNVYLEIINKATDYVYICSPYLILTREFTNAIEYASRRGVDVRILMPGIPDKKIPFLVARTYYKELIKSGIKIYEYTPGFSHSKLFVSDDVVSTVGSSNLDFRSFFLSFENGIFCHDEKLAKNIKNDLLATFKKSELITLKKYKTISKWNKIIGLIFRIFIPLL